MPSHGILFSLRRNYVGYDETPTKGRPMPTNDELGALFIIASCLKGEASIIDVNENYYVVKFDDSTSTLLIPKEDATIEEIRETIIEARS